MLLSTVLFFGFGPELEDTLLDDDSVEAETVSVATTPVSDLIGLNVQALNLDVNTSQEQSSCTSETLLMNCDKQLKTDGQGNEIGCAIFSCETNECCANACTPGDELVRQ
jgi:hypothetical protein